MQRKLDPAMIFEFIASQIEDAHTQWSLGTFGAIAEFSRDPDESVGLARTETYASAVTTRGGIRIDARPDIIPVAFETVTTQARRLDFVEAARASGTTTMQVIRHHVLANVLGPILVYATSLISVSMILSAGLSFLGLGVTPPEAEWGLMLNALRQAIYVTFGHMF